MSYDIINLITGRIGHNCIPQGERTLYDPEVDPRWTLQELREELGVEAVLLSEAGVIFGIGNCRYGVVNDDGSLSWLSAEEAAECFMLTLVPKTVQDVIDIWKNGGHPPVERPDWYVDWIKEWESYDSNTEEDD